MSYQRESDREIAPTELEKRLIAVAAAYELAVYDFITGKLSQSPNPVSAFDKRMMKKSALGRQQLARIEEMEAELQAHLAESMNRPQIAPVTNQMPTSIGYAHPSAQLQLPYNQLPQLTQQPTYLPPTQFPTQSPQVHMSTQLSSTKLPHTQLSPPQLSPTQLPPAQLPRPRVRPQSQPPYNSHPSIENHTLPSIAGLTKETKVKSWVGQKPTESSSSPVWIQHNINPDSIAHKDRIARKLKSLSSAPPKPDLDYYIVYQMPRCNPADYPSKGGKVIPSKTKYLDFWLCVYPFVFGASCTHKENCVYRHGWFTEVEELYLAANCWSELNKFRRKWASASLESQKTRVWPDKHPRCHYDTPFESRQSDRAERQNR